MTGLHARKIAGITGSKPTGLLPVINGTELRSTILLMARTAWHLHGLASVS